MILDLENILLTNVINCHIKNTQFVLYIFHTNHIFGGHLEMF